VELGMMSSVGNFDSCTKVLNTWPGISTAEALGRHI